MGDLSGKTFMVTGSNTGIGKVTAMELAARGARVHLANRSEQRTQPVLDDIRRRHGVDAAAFLPCDLADLKSVRAAVAQYLSSGEPLHCLINNAGLTATRGKQTVQGFQLTFGVNHLGHFALTLGLLPVLKASAPARIVNVSSHSHYPPRSIDFAAFEHPTRTIVGLREYEASKLCNVLFSRTLAKRLLGTGVTTYALHPGTVATDIWRRVPWPFRNIAKAFLLTVEQGARTTLYCATEPSIANETGLYYSDEAQCRPSRVAENDALAEELWRQSEAWCAR